MAVSCIPRSLFSWDFRVEGLDLGDATLETNIFSEQGTITAGGQNYAITKGGFASGRWRIENVAEAEKESAFFRAFDLVMGDRRFLLQAQSPVRRAFDIRSGSDTIGTIVPDHALTRRATIHCSGDLPELGQLFAFWLVALTWRRSSNNH